METSTSLTRKPDIMKSFTSEPSRKVSRPLPIQEVVVWENPYVVLEIVEKLGLSEKDAYKLFKDTIRFLWLAAMFGKVVPPPKIDEGWHLFILFTEDYREFCMKNLGVFIHHQPHHPDDKPDGGELLARTKNLIREHIRDDLRDNWDYDVVMAGDCEGHCEMPDPDCHSCSGSGGD